MEKLGIQPIQLLTQTFNFLVLLFILRKFLYKPILKALDDRRKKIEEGLSYAEQTKKEFEKSEQKKEEILQKALGEARKITQEAKKTAAKIEAEIMAKAEERAKEIIEKARKEAATEREQIEKEVKKEAVEIAARMVEKLMKDALLVTDHQAIVDKKLKELNKLVK